MFCPNCNRTANAGENFCMNCGTPLVPEVAPAPTTEAAPKPPKTKPQADNTPIFIGIIVAILALGILEVAADPMGILPDRPHVRKGSSISGSTKPGKEKAEKAQKGKVEKQSAAQESGEDDSLLSDDTVSRDTYSILEEYVNTIPKTTEDTYDRYIINSNHGEYYSDPCVPGLFNYDIDDYDNDGEPELLLLSLESDGMLIPSVCEVDDSGEVYTAATASVSGLNEYCFRFADAGRAGVHAFFVYKDGGDTYFCYERSSYESMLGDGWGIGFDRFSYDGDFHPEGSYSNSGSDYYEEDVPAFNSEMSQAGINANYPNVVNSSSIFSDYVNSPVVLAVSVRSMTDDSASAYEWLQNASPKDRLYVGQTTLYTSCSGSVLSLKSLSGFNYGNKGTASSGYILPNSGYEYITESDLAPLSKDEIRIARNEIYARRGRRFQDKELQAYFNQFDWYEGIYEPNEFSNDWLNQYEKQNLITITNYEKELSE